MSEFRDEVFEQISALSPDRVELRKFSWVVGGAFVALWAVLAHVLGIWGRGGDYPVLWWIGLGLIGLGTIVPIAVKPLLYVWMSLAFVMGFFMTRIILTLFFFLVVTPVGLVFKVIGRDALHRKLDPDAETYWIPKDYPLKGRTRFEKFF